MLFFFFLRSSIFQHVSIQIVYLVQSCTDDLLESFKKKPQMINGKNIRLHFHLKCRWA